MVPSAMTYSKSGSPRSALNARSNTPWLAHRRKRLNTEFQLPNMAGRSRQGAPVRAIQSTASTNWRLSAPERPGSPGLPGSRCAIWFHCASLRHDRSKAGLLSQPSISTQPAWEARTTDCQQALVIVETGSIMLRFGRLSRPIMSHSATLQHLPPHLHEVCTLLAAGLVRLRRHTAEDL